MHECGVTHQLAEDLLFLCFGVLTRRKLHVPQQAAVYLRRRDPLQRKLIHDKGAKCLSYLNFKYTGADSGPRLQDYAFPLSETFKRLRHSS